MATIYVLIKVDKAQNDAQRERIVSNLRERYGDAWRYLGLDSYLVAEQEPILTRELSDKIGVSGGDVGNYIVTKLDPYFGWGHKEVWEWIDTYGGK